MGFSGHHYNNGTTVDEIEKWRTVFNYSEDSLGTLKWLGEENNWSGFIEMIKST